MCSERLMNYEGSNSRKQGHVELTLYYVLCITNSIEISPKSRVRVDLRALVRKGRQIRIGLRVYYERYKAQRGPKG